MKKYLHMLSAKTNVQAHVWFHLIQMAITTAQNESVSYAIERVTGDVTDADIIFAIQCQHVQPIRAQIFFIILSHVATKMDQYMDLAKLIAGSKPISVHLNVSYRQHKQRISSKRWSRTTEEIN